MCKYLFRGALATIVALAIVPHEAEAQAVQKDVGQSTACDYCRSTVLGQVDFRRTPDVGQVSAFRQGNRGNCVSVAVIKAAIDSYSKHRVFAKVEKTDTGYRVTLQDGRTVDVTTAEVQFASANSDFVELGQGDDLSFANLALATMARNMQSLTGMASFESAIYELNNGQQPLDGARWIGLSHRVVQLTGRDISGYDSIVAYGVDTDLSRTIGHCVFVDMIGHGQHVRDMYGVPTHYGPEVRRVRIGRFRVRDQVIMKYEHRFSFVKDSVEAVEHDEVTASMNCGQGQSLQFDHNRYEDALEAAVRTGRPLVIKGGATWCAPCQQLKRTFSNQAIQQLLKEGAVFVKVEADRQNEPAAARSRAAQILRDLKVTRFPTTIVVSVAKTADGRYVLTELGNRVGMMSVSDLDALLKNAFKRAQ